MDAEQTFTVDSETAGRRLDRHLAACLPEISRSRIQAVIRDGGVKINGETARSSATLRSGDVVNWRQPAPVPCMTATAEDIPLAILFEDASLVVVDKPAGMVVHPGAGHAEGTLVSALLHHCGSLSQVGGVERPGIVHRLDKETSGCLVVAKNDAVHRALSAQFAGREVKKTYLALVEGKPKFPTGTVDAAIARHRVHRQKMAVSTSDRGREAVTDYRVIRSKDGLSLIECHPRTGRTHQIRIHLKHLGCPVVGDPLYGRRGGHTRHMLHAWKLAFSHPIKGKPIAFEAPPPAGFLDF